MRRGTVLIVGLLCVVLAAQVTLADSYYYESVTRTTPQKGKPQQDHMRAWVDGEKVRMEFPEGGHNGRVEEGAYMLTTNAGETVYMVNPAEKTYFEFDPAALLSFVEATGMMDIEFRDVSAEVLETGSGGDVLGHDTTRYKVRSMLTMDMNIMGMQRSDRMESTQELWLTPDVGADAWMMFLKWVPAGSDVKSYVEWAEGAGLSRGLPLKSTTITTVTNKKGKTSTMTSEMEVTTLRQEDIASSIFEIPADYTVAEVPVTGVEDDTEAESPLKLLKGRFGRKKKDGN
jgi:hypothetical protein